MVHPILKAGAFTIFFNVVSALIIFIFPFANAAFTGYAVDGDQYNAYLQNQSDTFNNPLTPGAEVQQSGLLVLRLFDLINIGFLQKILTFLFNLAFGILTIFEVIFRPYLDPTFAVVWWNALNALMGVMWGFVAIELWTLRKLTAEASN